MIIYEGMLPNQAVKVGENYVVCLPQGRYEIDGTQISSGYQGTQVVVPIDKIDTLNKITPAQKKVSHYVLKSGVEVSAEKVNETRSELNSYFDEDYEQYNFPSLEVEFEVRKRCEPYANAAAVYIEEPEEIAGYSDKLEFVGEQVDTGSKFVSTAYSLGRMSHQHYNGVFKVDVKGVLRDEFGKVVKDNDWKSEVPTHSFLEYAKINGTYVFTQKSLYKNPNDRVFMDLDSAKEFEKTMRKTIRQDIMSKISPEPMGELLRKEVYSDIMSLIDLINQIEHKQKSHYKKSAALTKANKVLDKVKWEEE